MRHLSPLWLYCSVKWCLVNTQIGLDHLVTYRSATQLITYQCFSIKSQWDYHLVKPHTLVGKVFNREGERLYSPSQTLSALVFVMMMIMIMIITVQSSFCQGLKSVAVYILRRSSYTLMITLENMVNPKLKPVTKLKNNIQPSPHQREDKSKYKTRFSFVNIYNNNDINILKLLIWVISGKCACF